ncbi:hypothetical protein Cdeb_01302 [Caldibacillus debilis GB1]|uniref:Uncharacterized protein n=1 Tax=Caldibacillus debilis GB1 TaxID=1339248 RepID=A0A420VDP3_9BACI|nr:hypothetical protein Cdeb_01302 [Caldibacillus debilis GB1]
MEKLTPLAERRTGLRALGFVRTLYVGIPHFYKWG